MTQEQITKDLIDAAHHALAEFNMMAQRSDYPLPPRIAETRYKLARALSLMEGKVFIGSLPDGEKIRAEMESLGML